MTGIVEPPREQNRRARSAGQPATRAASPIRLLRPLDPYASQNLGIATNGGGADEVHAALWPFCWPAALLDAAVEMEAAKGLPH